MLHFEDFREGQTFPLGPHRITEEAIISFAREFDPQPFHLDAEAARHSLLGGLAASGWHSTAMLMRLMCDACLSRSSILGSSGMDEVKWLAPVLAGDVLSGTFEITATRTSASRSGIGIVNFTSRLAGSDGMAKVEMTGMFFVRRRAA